jgi:integrase
MTRAQRPPAARWEPPVAAPKVYWNKRHRVFFGKYRLNGRWKTKTVPVNVDSEERATNWFGAWFKALQQTGVEPVNDEVKADDRKTIRRLTKRWLDWKRETLGHDRKAFEGFMRTLEKWVLPYPIADIDLEHELNLGHCTDWIEAVKKAGRAPMTTRNIVQTLRGFLVDVRGKGWVKLRENPLLDPYIRKVLGPAETVAGRNTIIHLSKEQVQQLFGCDVDAIAAARQIRNLIAVATGCRLGEMRAWAWSDFDLDAVVPTARIFRQVQFTGPDGEATAKDPKRHSHRVIPLHPSAAAALRWWKTEGWRELVGREPRPESPVFPSPNGEYATSRAADIFRADLEAAGLPTVFDGKHPFTFHALRRTFMSLLESEGVPRELIGALAGHAGKSVADRHYIAKNLGRFKEAIDRLPLPEAEELAWIR